MTKGLRCPNCDSTINKKVVLDFLLNQKAPHLRCKNAFCNVRWKRSVLEKYKDQLLGEAAKPAPKPKPKPAPARVEDRTAVTMPYPERFWARRPAMHKGQTWLDRIRFVARQYAEHNGVVSIDDLREWADKYYMQPESPSAWGSVFQGDEWKRVSQKNSGYRKSRSRKITVWALNTASTARVAV